MLRETLFAFIASLGFGIIFNIKEKKLFFAAVGGGLSWFSYSLLISFNINTILSLFISSVIFSIYSEVCARTLMTPVTTIIICSLIPLVPGAGMYYTMYEILTGDIISSLQIALDTIAKAGTLALGIIFVSTITKQIINLKNIREKLLKK